MKVRKDVMRMTAGFSEFLQEKYRDVMESQEPMAIMVTEEDWKEYQKEYQKGKKKAGV